MRQAFALAVLCLLPASASATDWATDIAVLAEQVERVHPRLHDCATADAFQRRADSLAARAGSLSDPQMAVEIQRLLASVGDGHTLLWPFGMKAGVLNRIPVMLWWFDEGLYVVDAADRRWVGQRVIRFGGMPAVEVLEALDPLVSHDNQMQFRWAAPFYATLSDFLVAVGATTSRERVTLTFEDGTAHEFAASPVDPETLELKLVAPPVHAPRWLQRRNENFYALEPEPGLLYVAVNAMQDEKGRTLQEFGVSIRPQLARDDRVILDVRLDNGGEASKADELLRSLIAFDTRGGKIVTLIGRMTFSAGQTFVTRLDQWSGTRFVGEPTGSRPNHYGNERPFQLPASGLRGTSSSGFNQPVTANDGRDAIHPDVAVPNSAADYFAGRDPGLEAALRMLPPETH